MKEEEIYQWRESALQLGNQGPDEDDWVQDWKDSVDMVGLKTYDAKTGNFVIKKENSDKPGYVFMHGCTATSFSFKEGLNLCRTIEDDTKLVLFVMLMHNYLPFNGFRPNKPQYSAHHVENSLVLMDGLPMFVLGVEELYVENGSPWLKTQLSESTSRGPGDEGG